MIKTKPATDIYRENYDKIFTKNYEEHKIEKRSTAAMTFDQAWTEWQKVAPFKANNMEFARFFFEAGKTLDKPEPCELLKKQHVINEETTNPRR